MRTCSTSGWDKTRAEQSCPTDVFRSLKVGDSEMERIAADEGLEVLQPELGTKPRIYYKNMHYFTKCFVSGSVVATKDGVEECVAGAEVIVSKDGTEIGRAKTDTFGEFKIDRLEPGSSGYQLEINSSLGNVSRSLDVGDDSLYLGVISLDN